eukprot:g3174.t1
MKSGQTVSLDDLRDDSTSSSSLVSVVRTKQPSLSWGDDEYKGILQKIASDKYIVDYDDGEHHQMRELPEAGADNEDSYFLGATDADLSDMINNIDQVRQNRFFDFQREAKNTIDKNSELQHSFSFSDGEDSDTPWMKVSTDGLTRQILQQIHKTAFPDYGSNYQIQTREEVNNHLFNLGINVRITSVDCPGIFLSDECFLYEPMYVRKYTYENDWHEMKYLKRAGNYDDLGEIVESVFESHVVQPDDDMTPYPTNLVVYAQYKGRKGQHKGFIIDEQQLKRKKKNSPKSASGKSKNWVHYVSDGIEEYLAKQFIHPVVVAVAKRTDDYSAGSTTSPMDSSTSPMDSSTSPTVIKQEHAETRPDQSRDVLSPSSSAARTEVVKPSPRAFENQELFSNSAGANVRSDLHVDTEMANANSFPPISQFTSTPSQAGAPQNLDAQPTGVQGWLSIEDGNAYYSPSTGRTLLRTDESGDKLPNEWGWEKKVNRDPRTRRSSPLQVRYVNIRSGRTTPTKRMITDETTEDTRVQLRNALQTVLSRRPSEMPVSTSTLGSQSTQLDPQERLSQPIASQQEVVPPYPWQIHKSKSRQNKLYFFNKQLGVSLWTSDSEGDLPLGWGYRYLKDTNEEEYVNIWTNQIVRGKDKRHTLRPLPRSDAIANMNAGEQGKERLFADKPTSDDAGKRSSDAGKRSSDASKRSSDADAKKKFDEARGSAQLAMGAILQSSEQRSSQRSPQPFGTNQFSRGFSDSQQRSSRSSNPQHELRSQNVAVFVANINLRASKIEVRKHFEDHNLHPVSVFLKEKSNGESKGLGLVYFSTQTEAQRAIQIMDKSIFQGKMLFVREDNRKEKGRNDRNHLRGNFFNRDNHHGDGVQHRTSRAVADSRSHASSNSSRPRMYDSQRTFPSKEHARFSSSSSSSSSGKQRLSENVAVYVANIDYDARKGDLWQHFFTHGTYPESVYLKHYDSGKPKGTAFVYFSTQEEADRAITNVDNTYFRGRQIVVHPDTRKREVQNSNGGRNGHGFHDGRYDRDSTEGPLHKKRRIVSTSLRNQVGSGGS